LKPDSVDYEYEGGHKDHGVQNCAEKTRSVTTHSYRRAGNQLKIKKQNIIREGKEQTTEGTTRQCRATVLGRRSHAIKRGKKLIIVKGPCLGVQDRTEKTLRQRLVFKKHVKGRRAVVKAPNRQHQRQHSRKDPASGAWEASTLSPWLPTNETRAGGEGRGSGRRESLGLNGMA